MPTLRQRLLAAHPGLPCDDSALVRSMYARDASNYRVEPLLVAFPRDAEEVAAIVRLCHAEGIPITARGSGTGMAGNAIGRGVVLDLRRHLGAIGAIDPDARTVEVEPGVVLDTLQQALAPQGLMFGPDPSSRSRATLGGMLGNDACGNHSVAYGRTSDHVIELDLVLADGTPARASRSGLVAVHAEDEDRVYAIADALRHAAQQFEHALRTEFSRCPRQVSGYAAHRLLPEHGFDIARLIAGSEGTLGIVTRARLALVPVPQRRQLVVIGYPDLITAARDVPALLTLRPSAVEAIDSAIVETLRARRGDRAVPDLPSGDAWLYLEFADTVAALDLPALEAAVAAGGRARSLQSADSAAAAQLWRLREEGAGLASQLLDGTRGRPGWEDAAVPPERLAEYLERMRDLAARHGYQGVLYGHFGAGCVHVRYDFDTGSELGRARMRAFLRESAAIVGDCGGSISGEHGDGRARSELLDAMYSPAALAAFAAIKQAFDPNSILNPQVIVDAAPVDADLPDRAPAPTRLLHLPDDGDDLGMAAARCVGVGKCVADAVTHMCPTYAVTRAEADGTRGRARALLAVFEGDHSTGTALQALDTCLSCRACASECPTGVDMATYKAELLSRHYRGRLRPRSHYTLARLPQWLHPLLPIAGSLNRLLRLPAVQALLRRSIRLHPQRRIPELAARGALPASLGACPTPRALVLADALTQALAPAPARALVDVLGAAGVPARLVATGDSAAGLISTGQFEAAHRHLARLLDRLDGEPTGIPIVVAEPSSAAVLAHDLPRLLDDPRAAAVAARIRTLTGALDECAPGFLLPAGFPDRVVLQPHCHERSLALGPDQADWLRARGVTVTEAAGCCGMGGSFGYEPEHYALSVAVAERSLLPAIDAEPTATVLVDGFGCRCQVDDLRPQAQPRHLAEVIAAALGGH